MGRFPAGASPFGCLDMAGNVSEFTQAWLAPYPEGELLVDPQGAAQGTQRVERGGHWTSTIPKAVSTYSREGRHPKSRSDWVGFRVCLSPRP